MSTQGVPTRINPAGIHAPAGQYSHGSSIAPGSITLHVAGQAGIDPAGRLLEGFEAQAHQAFCNLLAVLSAASMSAAHLVHVNYYIVDAANIDSLRSIRREYLPDPPPSSTALIVPRLIVPQWLFEVDAVAARMP